MFTEVLNVLTKERDKLDVAITALRSMSGTPLEGGKLFEYSGNATRRRGGRPLGSKNSVKNHPVGSKVSGIDDAYKKKQSRKMKQIWAERKGLKAA